MAEVEPNRVIRDYVQNGGASTWKHKELVSDLHHLTRLMAFHFFSPKTPDDVVLPTPLLAVAPHDKRVLGWFKLHENALGLKFEIGLNEHWIGRPKWELCETIAHELVHLGDQEISGYHAKTNYHRKEFVEVAEEIGLHPILGEGYHWRPADGPFARLMERAGVERPDYAKDLPKDPDGGILLPPGVKNWFDWDRGRATGGRIKGKSTLTLYTVEGCTKTPQCKIRSGNKALEIACMTCIGQFKPHTDDGT